MHLLNQGFTAPEIAERLELPASLANAWENRDYYGTVRHNAKAIYQKYLGWYDDNPANLDPLPPVEGAKKYVAYMGGADAVIRRAREDFKNGEYRFVAEVANKLVFADPANQEARRHSHRQGEQRHGNRGAETGRKDQPGMQLPEPSEGLQFTDPGRSHANIGFVQNELPKLMPGSRVRAVTAHPRQCVQLMTRGPTRRLGKRPTRAVAGWVYRIARIKFCRHDGVPHDGNHVEVSEMSQGSWAAGAASCDTVLS